MDWQKHTKEVLKIIGQIIIFAIIGALISLVILLTNKDYFINFLMIYGILMGLILHIKYKPFFKTLKQYWDVAWGMMFNAKK